VYIDAIDFTKIVVIFNCDVTASEKRALVVGTFYM